MSHSTTPTSPAAANSAARRPVPISAATASMVWLCPSNYRLSWRKISAHTDHTYSRWASVPAGGSWRQLAAAVALHQPRLVLVDLELDRGLMHIPPQPPGPASARAGNLLASPRRVEGRAACGQGEWHAHSTAQDIQLGICRASGMRAWECGWSAGKGTEPPTTVPTEAVGKRHLVRVGYRVVLIVRRASRGDVKLIRQVEWPRRLRATERVRRSVSGANPGFGASPPRWPSCPASAGSWSGRAGWQWSGRWPAASIAPPPLGNDARARPTLRPAIAVVHPGGDVVDLGPGVSILPPRVPVRRGDPGQDCGENRCVEGGILKGILVVVAGCTAAGIPGVWVELRE